MTKTALHLTDVQRALDTARINKQRVDVSFWKKSTGDIVHLKGWLVTGSHWRGGTHRFFNSESGQLREIRDINIFNFNGHEVYV